MFKKMALFCLTGLFFLLISGVLSSPLVAEIEKETMNRRVDPIDFTGKLMPDLIGKEIEKLRVYSFVDGKWRPLVFQFDERHPNLNFFFNQGEEADEDKANHILDPQDKVFFYIYNVGDRVPREQWPPGVAAGQEITFIDPLDQGRAWVYIFYYSENPPPCSDEKYVWLEDADLWRKPDLPFMARGRSWGIDGFVNKVKGRYYRTAFNKNYVQPAYAGGCGLNLLDRMKFRFKVRMFFGMLKLGFDENDCVGGIYALKVGPARGFGRMWMSAVFPAGIKSPRVAADVCCYDTTVIVPGLINVPINPGVFLTDFVMGIGNDLNENARGMKFYNSNNLEGFLVDGKTDEREKNMNHDLDEWRLITGPQGTMINRSDWDVDYARQANPKVYFEDDEEEIDKPEGVPGKLGYYHNTSRVESLEPREYKVQLDWYFPVNFYNPERLNIEIVEEYLNVKGHPLRVQGGGQEELNQGGAPDILKPAK